MTSEVIDGRLLKKMIQEGLLKDSDAERLLEEHMKGEIRAEGHRQRHKRPAVANGQGRETEQGAAQDDDRSRD